MFKGLDFNLLKLFFFYTEMWKKVFHMIENWQ